MSDFRDDSVGPITPPGVVEQVSYLRRRFAELMGRTWREVVVHFTDDEEIVVHLSGDPTPWVMEIGSDDDSYIFERDDAVLRFPLEPINNLREES